ncbi:MucBP domain-containing protein [Listeria sp. FSL L7-0091]|uniref:MucBP domain-containing protein n=1 Tax=Listeria farberi TaxID=2713500 RepID=UPI0016232986|nr:MucBP domain-containing protein [Listeria farberi]MBC2260538.1 MucBP domain-containing protein [Listeria farberi]
MNKKLGMFLFAVMLIFAGFLLGDSEVYAAESDTSDITYKYIDFETLTDEQKDSIIEGNPSEVLTNDYENYSFVYKKNTSGGSPNPDNNQAGGSNNNGISVSEVSSGGDSNNGNSGNGNSDNGNTLLKTGDVGPDVYLIILGFILLGSGIGLLTLKKRHAKQLLLFLVVFSGGSLMIGSVAQAVENTNIKPEETMTVTKGTKETKKPASIEGYTYVGYIHTSENDITPPTPPVEQGTVTVNYQNEQGDSIASSETLKGNVGEKYQTVQKDIAGYDFKEVQGNTTGEFTNKAQVVTYIYDKKPVPAANVTIEYVDQDGTQIHEPKVMSGNVGDPYDATGEANQLQIEGYTLDTSKLPANATGVFTSEAQQVIYVYTKNPVPAANVTIEYVDQDGTQIHEPKVMSGNVGDPYDATGEANQLQIEGYTLDTSKLPANATGVFTSEAQQVIYVYTKNPVPAANVTIEYVDQDGTQIHEPKVMSGNVGDSYDATGEANQLQIEGYTLDTSKLPANATGVFTSEAQQVIYVYTKNPLADVTITVKFVDMNGNPFTVPDFTTMKNGEFVPNYPNLNQYQLKLDYNQQLYNQNQLVPDIVIQGKEGETYSLPSRMTFNIIDDKGNPVPYLVSLDPDDSQTGIINYYNITSVPDNREGVLTDKDVVVTYKIEGYAILIPAP